MLHLTLPLINKQFLFPSGNYGGFMAKVMKKLPDPDDKAITYNDNEQVELFLWNYQLNHLSFRVIKALANGALCQDL